MIRWRTGSGNALTRLRRASLATKRSEVPQCVTRLIRSLTVMTLVQMIKIGFIQNSMQNDIECNHGMRYAASLRALFQRPPAMDCAICQVHSKSIAPWSSSFLKTNEVYRRIVPARRAHGVQLPRPLAVACISAATLYSVHKSVSQYPIVNGTYATIIHFHSLH